MKRRNFGIGKLRARYPVVTICHVFGVHRSSYKYLKNCPEKPDGRRTALLSQALELHGISHGSAGARSIATMATQRGYETSGSSLEISEV